MANWYYAVGTQTEGPVAEDELTRMARQGTLSPSSYVVREGESAWQALGDVERDLGLTRNPSGTYEPPAPAPAPTPDAGPPGASGAGGWAAPGTVAPGGQPGWGAPPQPDQGQPGWGSPPGGQQPGWGAPPQQPGQFGQPGQPGQPGWGAPPGGQQPWDQGGAQNPWAAPGAGGWSSDYGQAYSGPQPAGTMPGGAEAAQWWQRFVAKLIDFVIIAIPGFILFFAVAWNDVQDRIDANDGGFQVTFGARALLGQLLWSLLGLAYYAILNGRGQTLGKMALGIKVVGANSGQPIGPGKGVARHILQFLAGFLSCIGLVFILVDSLWPLWDGRKQAIHDKLGSSVVIRAR